MEAVTTLDQPGGRQRVLVIGAEPIVREWAQFKLEPQFEVEQAVDLAEGLRAVQRIRPHAIVLDPDGYNGLRETLVPALCESAPDAALVVLSECTGGGAVNRAVRAGARGYLSKSTTDVDLAGTLRTVIQGVLTLDQSALRSLVEPASGRPGGVSAALLSSQELKVLALVAEGLTNREIGARLFLSPHTVKNYLRNAADKLGVATRLDAVLEASRQGLIDLPDDPGRSRNARRSGRAALYAFPNVWALLSESLPYLAIPA